MKDEIILEHLGYMPMLMKSIFHGFDSSIINLPINKTQQKVLMIIKKHNISTMTEISKKIGMEKGSFTTTTDHLIEKGLVERKRLKSDRRKISLELTHKGNEIAEEMIKTMEVHLQKKLSCFDHEEKEEFINALKVISKCTNKINGR